MSEITSITINKIRGIENNQMDVQIFSNKPNIIVAPNGFGKSSITAAFSSLKIKRLEVDKENWFNEQEHDDSYLKITYQENKENIEMIADKSKNEILNNFKVFVINNQIKSKAKIVKIKNINQSVSEMIIKDIVLKNKIPKNVKIKYEFSKIKEIFKNNKKVAINLYETLEDVIFTIYERKDLFNKFNEIKKYQKGMDKILRVIISLSGTKNDILIKIEKDEDINKIVKDLKFNNIFTLNIFKDYIISEKLILLIELIYVYKENKINLNGIIKRIEYEKYKNRIITLFEMYNTRSKIIKIVEEKDQLIAKFPKAKSLSNGEIDIFSLILLLEQAKIKLTGKKNILIIDEIFDYLDDINMITAQSYIIRTIEEFKENKKEIYPIIMTHLDPLYFKNYTFSKMKISYLLSDKSQFNSDVKNLIINRDKYDNKSDNSISKYYLHYNPKNIDILTKTDEVKFVKNYNMSNEFKKELYQEVSKYVKNQLCDYLMVLIGFRIIIEEYMYKNLSDNKIKEKFLEEHKTKNKINIAEENGVFIPDSFRILSVLYNDIAHVNNKNDPEFKKINYIAIKLKNIIIHNIISKSINFIKEQCDGII